MNPKHDERRTNFFTTTQKRWVRDTQIVGSSMKIVSEDFQCRFKLKYLFAWRSFVSQHIFCVCVRSRSEEKYIFVFLGFLWGKNTKEFFVFRLYFARKSPIVTATQVRHVTHWYILYCRNPVGSHEYIFFVFWPYPLCIFPQAYNTMIIRQSAK